MTQPALKNDRKNHLGNSERQFHIIKNLLIKSKNQGVTNFDIGSLLDISYKLSYTLKGYIDAGKRRSTKNKDIDEMLTQVNDEFLRGISYNSFPNEIAWLQNCDDYFASICEDFIRSLCINKSINVNLNSTNELSQRIILFRKEFPRNTISRTSSDFQKYLDETSRIAIGTFLVCDDGLKYYDQRDTNNFFSVRSIWLGSRIFLYGANNLLAMGGYSRSLI